MKAKKMVRFTCPDCDEKVALTVAAMLEDGHMVLIALCKCGNKVVIDIEKLIVGLVEPDTKGN